MSGKYAATLMEVSRRVPIRYATLLEKRKLPGFPPDHAPSGKAKFDVDAIRGWIHDHKSAHNAGSNGNGHGNEREQALIRKKNIEIERDTFKLDVERGRYELKTVVKEQVLTHIGALFRELDKAFKHELPPRVEGLSAGEIAKLNGKRLVELRERLAKHFDTSIANDTNGNGSA